MPDGAPEIIANDVATLVGGSWSDNGSLLVAGAVGGRPGLFVAPAGGGVAKRVEVSLTKDGFFLYWPEFLPGSEDFLVVAGASKIEESEIYLATLRDGWPCRRPASAPENDPRTARVRRGQAAVHPEIRAVRAGRRAGEDLDGPASWVRKV